jgi:hypothetical protein
MREQWLLFADIISEVRFGCKQWQSIAVYPETVEQAWLDWNYIEYDELYLLTPELWQACVITCNHDEGDSQPQGPSLQAEGANLAGEHTAAHAGAGLRLSGLRRPS